MNNTAINVNRKQIVCPHCQTVRVEGIKVELAENPMDWFEFRSASGRKLKEEGLAECRKCGKTYAFKIEVVAEVKTAPVVFDA